MDRKGISSPVLDNNDGVNNYITKASIFDLQRQVQGAQSRLREHIEKKLFANKEEQDARMEEIRALIKSTSPSSS